MTMIELMVTIAILAILLGLAAPSMTRFPAQWRMSNAVNAFTGSLRTARAEAIARAKPVVMCRVSSASSTACQTSEGTTGYATGWIVFADNNGNGSYNSGTDELLLRQDTQSGVTFQATGGSYSKLTFQPNGLMGSTPASYNIQSTFDNNMEKVVCLSKPGRMLVIDGTQSCPGA